MRVPEGKLTPAQYEIMELVWQAGEAGLSVGDVWQAIGARREVTRTTAQNLVERLEKRRWLKRFKSADGFRYRATTRRDETARVLAEEFVDEFFSGSASDLVSSLFGSQRISREELARLRQLLEERFGQDLK